MLKEIQRNHDAFAKVFEEGGQAELSYVPFNELIKTAKFFGIELDVSELDTNAWQLDFWWEFEYKNESYTISGSVFYGSYTISKD